MIDAFQFSSLPEILFGEGVRNQLVDAARKKGKRILLLTGSSSIHNSGHGEEIISGLKGAGLLMDHEIIAHEPSPAVIDRIVDQQKGSGVDVVVAVGGGASWMQERRYLP
jgi:alcohol dehydrogenase class IV